MAAATDSRRRATARRPWSIQKAPQTRIPNREFQHARQRTPLSLISTMQILLYTLLAFAILVTPAFTFEDHSHEVGSRHIPAEKDEAIMFDPRPVPAPPLFRRDSPSTAEETGKATKTAKKPISSTSSASDASSTSVESASNSNDSPSPKAFDGGLGSNFTQPSCSTFLQNMISNDSFSSCQPFSVLLQVSQKPKED